MWTEISNPLQVIADTLEVALRLGIRHSVDEHSLRMMSAVDEREYVHRTLAVSLADEWLKNGPVERFIRKSPGALGNSYSAEYEVDVVILTKEEYRVLRSAAIAAVRAEQHKKVGNV